MKKELLDKGFAEDKIDKFNSLFDAVKTGDDAVMSIKNLLSKIIGVEINDIKVEGDYATVSDVAAELINICKNLIEIIETVTKNVDVKINFNPTLVRGMGYYTGPIFEIKSEKFSGSVGGGGRYDKMVGKFIGTDTPALGISIGFERIIGIYLDDDYKIPNDIKKIAYLIEKGISIEKKSDIVKKALEERKKGNVVYIAELAKNKKFQCEKLEAIGYTEFVTFNA